MPNCIRAQTKIAHTKQNEYTGTQKTKLHTHNQIAHKRTHKTNIHAPKVIAHTYEYTPKLTHTTQTYARTQNKYTRAK